MNLESSFQMQSIYLYNQYNQVFYFSLLFNYLLTFMSYVFQFVKIWTQSPIISFRDLSNRNPYTICPISHRYESRIARL